MATLDFTIIGKESVSLAVGKAGASLDRLAGQLDKVKNKKIVVDAMVNDSGARDKLASLGVAADKVKSKSVKITASVDDRGVATKLAGVSAATKEVDKSSKAAAEGGIKGMASGMGGLTTIVAGTVGIMGVKAVQAAGDFQAQLTRLVTSAGEADSKIGMVGKAILQMATDTGTSTTQLTSGMYMIESAGFHAGDGLTVLKAAAQGAKAENANLGTVANAVTDILTDYHRKAGDAADVTSKLVATTASGKVTFEDLSGAMSSIAPIASASHVSLAEMLGDMAEMTSHGVSADSAAQNMANAIRSISNPSSIMTKELAQLGLRSDDLSQKLGQRGLSGTFNLIAEAILKNMGPSGAVMLNTFNTSKIAAEDANKMFAALPPNLQAVAKAYMDGGISSHAYTQGLASISAPQASLIKQWATVENQSKGFSSALRSGNTTAQSFTQAMAKATGNATSMNVALMLTGENASGTASKIDYISKATTEAGGNVQGWAEIQKNFNQKMDQTKASLQSASIAVGQVLLPVVEKLADAFSKLFQWISKNSSWLLPLVGILGSVGLAFMVVAKAMAVWGGIVKISTAIMAAFNIVMDANIFAIIVIAILALVGAFIYFWNKSAAFRDFWKGLWADIKKIVSAVVDWFTGSFIPFFVSIWNKVKKVIDEVVGWFKKNLLPPIMEVFNTAKDAVSAFVKFVEAVFGLYVKIFKAVISVVAPIWKAFWGFFVEIVKVVWDGVILPVLKFYWQVIVAIFKAVMAVIIGIWKFLWDTIVGVLKGIWTIIVGIFTGVFTIIKGIFQFFADLFTGKWSKLWDDIKTIFSGVWKIISSYFKGALEIVGGLFKGFADFFKGIWKGISTFVVGIVHAIGGLFETLGHDIAAVAEKIWHFIVEAFDKIKAFLVKWGPIILSVLVPFIGLPLLIVQHWQSIVGFFKDIFNKVVGFFVTLGHDIAAIAEKIWHVVVEAFDKVKAFLIKWGPIILSVVAPFIGLPLLIFQHWQSIVGFFKDIWNKIVGFFTNLVNDITKIWNQIFAFLSKIAANIWHTVVGVFTNFKNDLISGSQNIADFFTNIWNKIFAFLSKIATNIWHAVVGVFTNFKNDLISGSQNIADFFTNIWNKIATFFTKIATNIWHSVVGFFINLKNDLVYTFQGFSDFFTKIWNDISSFVVNIAHNIWHAVVDVFTHMKDGLVQVFKDIANFVFVNPINFVIKYVIDGGINDLVHGVGDIFGQNWGVHVNPITPFAKGGVVPGSGSGDSVHAMLTPGEGVVTKKRMDELGGKRFIDWLNSNHGGPTPTAGGLPGYDLGGLIGDIGSGLGHAASAVGHAISGAAHKVVSWARGATADAAQGILNATIYPLADSISTNKGLLGPLPHDIAHHVGDSIVTFLRGKDAQDNKASGGSGPGNIAFTPSAGVRQWDGLILRALQALGQPASWLATVERRMNQESGGNPNAINRTDINAQQGDPSRGLMQTIMTTFNAYKPAGANNIYDPYSNIYAGLNYAIHRYGSLSALNRPGGYANGALVNSPTLANIAEDGPELVLPLRKRSRVQSLLKQAGLSSNNGQGGRGDSYYSLTVNANEFSADDLRIAFRKLQALDGV